MLLCAESDLCGSVNFHSNTLIVRACGDTRSEHHQSEFDRKQTEMHSGFNISFMTSTSRRHAIDIGCDPNRVKRNFSHDSRNHYSLHFQLNTATLTHFLRWVTQTCWTESRLNQRSLARLTSGPVLDHTQNLLETKTAPIIINISSFSCFVWKDPKIKSTTTKKRTVMRVEQMKWKAAHIFILREKSRLHQIQLNEMWISFL